MRDKNHDSYGTAKVTALSQLLLVKYHLTLLFNSTSLSIIYQLKLCQTLSICPAKLTTYDLQAKSAAVNVKGKVSFYMTSCHDVILFCSIKLLDDDAKYPKPRGLKVKFISPIGFKLKWRDPKDAKTLQVKGYRVTWKQKKGQTQKSKVITRRSYSVKGLTAESTYLFRVQTVYASKVSKSLSLFCKTQKELGVLSPSNFKAKAIGTTVRLL